MQSANPSSVTIPKVINISFMAQNHHEDDDTFPHHELLVVFVELHDKFKNFVSKNMTLKKKVIILFLQINSFLKEKDESLTINDNLKK